MAVYDAPAMNGTGIDEVLGEVTLAVPIFTPMFLLFVFGVIFISGYRKQKQDSGVGDAPQWATIAGVVTTIVALILSTRTGLIDLATVVIVIVITIFSGIWLFSSRDKV